MLLTVFFCCRSIAQQNADLRVPATPAFSILGYEPSSVMRPVTTKKLSGDLLNSFDKDGKLLMNLGLEVSPYWLKSRSDLDRKTYLNPGFFQSISHTFKLSAATVKDTATGYNMLGLGFRMQPVRGQLTEAFQQLETEVRNSESIMGAAIAMKIAPLFTADQARALIKLEETLRANADLSKKEIDAVMQKANKLKAQTPTLSTIEIMDKIVAEIESDRTKLKELVEKEGKRNGLSLEIAGAARFITDAVQTGSSFRKAGIWASLNNYVSPKDALTMTTRIMFTRNDTTFTNADIAFGYIREEKDFNISLEAVFRWYRAEIPDLNISSQPILRVEKKFTYRLAAQASYTISTSVSINLSIGKEFDDPRPVPKTFFSILGLNYSIYNLLRNPSQILQ